MEVLEAGEHFMEALWRLYEVCETLGDRWKYIGVCMSKFVEVCTKGRGSLYGRSCKSME